MACPLGTWMAATLWCSHHEFWISDLHTSTLTVLSWMFKLHWFFVRYNQFFIWKHLKKLWITCFFENAHEVNCIWHLNYGLVRFTYLFIDWITLGQLVTTFPGERIWNCFINEIFLFYLFLYIVANNKQ